MGESIKFRNAIAIASGKGGVGKTNISVNLSLALRKMNKRVTLFDADMALANAHIVMGVQPTLTLVDVLDDRRSLADVCTEGPLGVKLISGGSGLSELMNVSTDGRRKIIHSFAELEADCDFLIVDTAAGIEDNVLEFVRACNRIMIIVVGEPAAFIDAYACIKVLHQINGIQHFDVIVNRARDVAHGEDVFRRFKGIVDRFLDASLYHAASIPEDNQLHASVARCSPITIMNPDAPSARAIAALAASIIGSNATPTNHDGSFFVADFERARSETSHTNKIDGELK
jgi:flagellar biosynthesis protein FlhG